MNRKKIMVIVFFQVFTISSFGQLTQAQLDSIVNKYVLNLHSTGIDTVCIYNEYCTGCLFTPTSTANLCTDNFSSLPTYIFWKRNGKTFITKKDICFDYSTIAISNNSFWQYYFTTKNKIKKEELKTPKYTEIVNGKKETRSLDIDNSIYFKITIDAGNESVTKNINSFYFTEHLGASEEINLNYGFNMATSLANLHFQIQDLIKHESVKNKFKRTLR